MDNIIPVRSHKYRESGVLRTTGNIGSLPSLIISREVCAKPIIFIGTLLGAYFITFHVEGEGKNIEVQIIKNNMELRMKLNSFKYPDGNYLDQVIRLDPMKLSQ